MSGAFGGLVGYSTAISAISNSLCVADAAFDESIYRSYRIGYFEANATFVRLFGNYGSYDSVYMKVDQMISDIDLSEVIQKMKDLDYADLGFIFDGDNYPTLGF